MSKFVIELPANLVVLIFNLMEKLMLNSAHIQNFRLFKDFQIDDLARVNLIVGKNNVGKSSLLEAINLLNNPQPMRALYSLLESRGEIVPNGKHDDQSGYEFVRLFNNGNKKMDITVKGDENLMNIQWMPKKNSNDSSSSDKQSVSICESGFGVHFGKVGRSSYIHIPSSGNFVGVADLKQASIKIESNPSDPPCIFTT